jgi:DNA-binding ferritin-like protein
LPDPARDIAYDNMVNEWGDGPYPQLSVLLVHLRFLSVLHQTHHWTAAGDPFYGDHLLFERLYDGLQPEIDDVAENAVGFGTAQSVDLQLQCQQLLRLVQQFAVQPAVPSVQDLARLSLAAEVAFLAVVKDILQQLDERGMLDPGLDNMLQGLADRHNRNVYLLKRRCATGG